MPLYEYYCNSCQASFEQLRPAQQADNAAVCPSCRAESAKRVLSLFARTAVTAGGSMANSMEMPMSGGCCGGGGCGCHN